jgi:hypothetical protein
MIYVYEARPANPEVDYGPQPVARCTDIEDARRAAALMPAAVLEDHSRDEEDEDESPNGRVIQLIVHN